ncbi:MAG: hypothetical protein DRJ69_03420 [Thermoprotei archaeon]|nr:MAG: hypothetical protein DRJ69_03420 [Thermoprotei archaeon]
MRVNKELIEARIREINDAIQKIRNLIAKRFDELTVYEKLALRYLVIQLVEAASSICIHILINVFNEKAAGFPECFTRLGVKGVISENLAEKLSSAARLRNLLVHRYWTIIDEKVYEDAKAGLEDFKRYIFEIREYLSENHDPENLEFKYYKLTADEKRRLLKILKNKLKNIDDIVFAYIHGGFTERDEFRDIDIALWIKNVERAYYYTVNLSAKLEAELGIPIDIQVINEAPLPFKHHVFTQGKLLFSKDESLRTTIVDETIRKYIDLIKINKIAENLKRYASTNNSG